MVIPITSRVTLIMPPGTVTRSAESSMELKERKTQWVGLSIMFKERTIMSMG